jgi:hypothetical protein
MWENGSELVATYCDTAPDVTTIHTGYERQNGSRELENGCCRVRRLSQISLQ